MPFYVLCLAIFIMFFQPGYIYPWIQETYQPVRNSAIAATVTYIFAREKSTKPFLNINTNKFFIWFVVMQFLSSIQLGMMATIDNLMYWFKIGIVYFLITRLVTDEGKVRKVSIILVLALVYLSYFSLSKFVINFAPGDRAGGYGMYENSNDLALILVATIPLILLIVNSAVSFWVRMLFIAIAFMFTINMLFTASRNGLLGLLSVGLISILSADKIHKILKALLVTMLLVGVLTIGISNVVNRKGMGAGLRDESSEMRIEQWTAAVRLMMHHPLLGVGRDQFVDNIVEYGGIRGMEPHNTLVKVFSECGLLGGIFFLLFAVYPIYEARRFFRKDLVLVPGVYMYRFVTTGLIGFWLCAFFSNRMQFNILYVMVALDVAIKENIMGKQK